MGGPGRAPLVVWRLLLGSRLGDAGESFELGYLLSCALDGLELPLECLLELGECFDDRGHCVLLC